ncbi:hypothetical protein [Brevundimonas sp. M20]|uniref:hypothetical protein n=1 Tax=Brevundimonas sp. M20 TaxID=2591463 RepID=UPI0011462E39|nr:hypothetical protein [Brevundimonas sp. M20]QDH72925.1 hypothetical protein FKQ52_05530 [Brevundimonas sp. M20]
MRWNQIGWASVVAAAGLFISVADARAQTPPEGFVWYVLNALNGFYLDVDDPTNRPPLVTEIPDGVLEPVEVSGDDRTDWLIRWPDSTQFCGTGGCRATLYLSGEDGFIRAFDRQALRFEVKTVDGEVRVEAALHHLYCDSGRNECLRAWAWEPAAGRLQERPSSDGISRLTIVAPVDLGEEADGSPILPDWTPSTLEEIRFHSRVWRPATTEEGPSLCQAELFDTPDVNGDGLRDWVFTPAGECDGEPESGFQVWVTMGPGPGPQGRGGPVALAYTAPPERWAEYEVSERPAMLMVVAPCGEGADCGGIPLRWNASTGRLVE